VKAALDEFARRHGVKLRLSDVGSLCLTTPVCELCVLVVPYRSEFEISLRAPRDGVPFRYPLFSVQEALGVNVHGIMFSNATLDGAISVLVDLVSRLLAAAEIGREQLIRRIQVSFDESVERTSLADRREMAERLWNAHQHAAAAEMYDGLPDLSAAERKRLHLLKSGKLS
jgi:hypothetical protein